jgi:NADPH-dependent 2,4-dienoyl-CoA reductase/sulfur reductase-like enzyme
MQLLLLLPSVVPATGDIASLARSLLGLLAPSAPRGEPWPRVPGPVHACHRSLLHLRALLPSQDKVCIVGAGPAGVHMALKLKQRNYTRVVVLEKSNRVGRLHSAHCDLYHGLIC